jgi:amino acid permease
MGVSTVTETIHTIAEKGRPSMKRVALYGTVFVLIHLVVNLLHARAHTELQIGVSSFQLLFVVGVIMIAPLLAMVLLWTSRQRLGLVLLTASMAGAGLFGLYYHFVLPSPDHVAHVAEGFWGDVFRMTAVILALSEALGSILGFVWLRTQTNSVNTANAYRMAS